VRPLFLYFHLGNDHSAHRCPSLPTAVLTPHPLRRHNLSWISKQSLVGILSVCILHHCTPLFGAVITPMTLSSDKSDGETVPLPVIISKECLPVYLDVYDDDTFRTINNKDAWDDKKMDIWKKFLARCPIQFTRIFPVRILTTLGPLGLKW
jgi:hypothetical protein